MCEAMAGSLSVASTAVLSAKVAVVDSGEVDSLQYVAGSPGTLSWGTPALTEESSVYSVSTFMGKCLLCKYNFRVRN
jgi:hypothetical protein